jgi:hypothetical protein
MHHTCTANRLLLTDSQLNVIEQGGRNCLRRNGNIDILIDLRTPLQPSIFSQGNYSTIDHNLSNYMVSLVAEPIAEPLDVMSSVLVMFVGGG